MPKTVLNDLKDAGDELIHTISSFSEEQINISPFEGSWTAGQVADHLLKANTGVLKVLYGKTGKNERPADEKAPEIKKLFLDFSLKFKSAEQIIPSNLPDERDILLNALKINMAALYEAANNLDLSEVCLDVEVRGFGGLTRLEWLYLVCYHTERHIYQLENIFQKTVSYSHIFSQKIS